MANAHTLEDILSAIDPQMQPHVRVRRGGLTILPRDATGFPVALDSLEAGYVVRFGGWYEMTDDIFSALRLLMLGLGESSRLRVESRGGRAMTWAVECRQGPTGWREIGEISVPTLRFWQRPQSHYLTNDWPMSFLQSLQALLPPPERPTGAVEPLSGPAPGLAWAAAAGAKP